MTVRVKGGMSLRNSMWHGVRNGIIMQNTIYAGNKLTEERVMFSRQFYTEQQFFDAADSNTSNRILWTGSQVGYRVKTKIELRLGSPVSLIFLFALYTPLGSLSTSYNKNSFTTFHTTSVDN